MIPYEFFRHSFLLFYSLCSSVFISFHHPLLDLPTVIFSFSQSDRSLPPCCPFCCSIWKSSFLLFYDLWSYSKISYLITPKDLNLGISDKMSNVFMGGYIIIITVIGSIHSPTISLFLYIWIVFHSIYVPHFYYPSFSWRKFMLIRFPSYCEENSNGQDWATIWSEMLSLFNIINFNFWGVLHTYFWNSYSSLHFSSNKGGVLPYLFQELLYIILLIFAIVTWVWWNHTCFDLHFLTPNF